MESPPRLFLLGAGFSKPAGLPLAAELMPLLLSVADGHLATDEGYSHLRNAFERYEEFLEETDPAAEFDLESFGAWLDWEHALRLKGSDTFSEHGNQAGLQLRWAIGTGPTPAERRTTTRLVSTRWSKGLVMTTTHLPESP